MHFKMKNNHNYTFKQTYSFIKDFKIKHMIKKKY